MYIPVMWKFKKNTKYFSYSLYLIQFNIYQFFYSLFHFVNILINKHIDTSTYKRYFSKKLLHEYRFYLKK